MCTHVFTHYILIIFSSTVWKLLSKPNKHIHITDIIKFIPLSAKQVNICFGLTDSHRARRYSVSSRSDPPALSVMHERATDANNLPTMHSLIPAQHTHTQTTRTRNNINKETEYCTQKNFQQLTAHPSGVTWQIDRQLCTL